MWLFLIELMRFLMFNLLVKCRFCYKSSNVFSIHLSTNYCHTHSGIFLLFRPAKNFFSKYFSVFPPRFSSSSQKYILHSKYFLPFPSPFFLTSTKEIFYSSICSKKNCWRVAITYSVLSLYLFIDRNQDCRRRQSRSIPGQKFALRQLHLHYWPVDPFRRRREMFS